MYTCNKCRSTKIKTRTNMSYCSPYVTVVNCKNCGSTDIEKVDPKKRKFRR